MIAISALGRGTYELRASQDLPLPREEIFPFFADARNLERLTPPSLQFVIVTPGPIDLRAGAVIDYRIRVHGIPLDWRTEITGWEPPVWFADTQVRGPYRLWNHEHRFEPIEGGTRCIDIVRYRPRGGALANLLVRRDLHRIFRYRSERLPELLTH